MTDTFDERLMTRYLLDDLHDEERESVQERVAADAEFYEALCALEDELIVRYHRGELGAHDEKLFVRAFSSSPSRRHRVESARLLIDTFRDLKAARPPRPFRRPAWQRAREWLLAPRMVPNFALAAAAVALVASVPLGMLLARYTPNSSQPSRAATSTSGASTRRVVAMFILSDGDDRQRAAGDPGAQVLTIPRFVNEVALDAPVASGVTTLEGLEIDVVAVDGQRAIAQASPPRLTRTATATLVTVSIRASDLPDGLYTLTIGRAGGGAPDVAAQAFRVTHE